MTGLFDPQEVGYWYYEVLTSYAVFTGRARRESIGISFCVTAFWRS